MRHLTSPNLVECYSFGQFLNSYYQQVEKATDCSDSRKRPFQDLPGIFKDTWSSGLAFRLKPVSVEKREDKFDLYLCRLLHCAKFFSGVLGKEVTFNAGLNSISDRVFLQPQRLNTNLLVVHFFLNFSDGKQKILISKINDFYDAEKGSSAQFKGTCVTGSSQADQLSKYESLLGFNRVRVELNCPWRLRCRRVADGALVLEAKATVVGSLETLMNQWVKFFSGSGPAGMQEFEFTGFRVRDNSIERLSLINSE